MNWRRTGRKFISAGLAVFMIVLWGCTGIGLEKAYAAEGDFAGGDGSAVNPYQITKLEQLNNMRNYQDKHFILMNNLDFNLDTDYENTANKTAWTTGTGWTPIGTTTSPFTGVLDGGGHTISGLMISPAKLGTPYTFGLFASINSGAEIKNIALEDVNIPNKKGYSVKAGGLACECGGSVTNCSVSGTVAGSGYVGGLVGTCTGTISNSYSTATVIGYNLKGSPYKKGITGGGLVGILSGASAEITGSYFSGTISLFSVEGGLVGKADGSTLSNCYSTGYLTGVVTLGGGLVGDADKATVRNCYALGSIEPYTYPVGGYQGGLIGHVTGTTSIEYCYSAGSVTGTTPSGLIGCLGGTGNTLTSCYYNSVTSGCSDTDKGTPKTPAEMRTAGTFTAWDFGTAWDIVNTETNCSYPYLRGNAQSPAPGSTAKVQIVTQPQNAAASVGGNAGFSVEASGTGLTYQWQINTGSGFENISNGGQYSGADTAALSITAFETGMAGYVYRVIVTGTEAPAATSNNAVLTQANSADLTGLTLSGSPVNFTFSGNTYTYNDITVENSVASITVTPTGDGTITVDGTAVATGTTSAGISLTEGVEKAITITVSETGKSVKTYTLKVTRLTNTYTVTYDPSSGSVDPASQVKLYGSTYGKGSDGTTDAAMPTPTWAGHTFSGWFTAASGGTKISDSDTVSITGDTTLYAQWTTNAAPTYSASVSQTNKTFATVGIGYSSVAAQDFTITNDGSGTITNLSATLASSGFEISTAPASSISPAGMATVSVRPVTGLSSGDYTDTLTITADNGISLTVTLSFTVLAPTIDPASRNYDLNAPADITTTITWNGATSVTDAVYSINSDVTIYTLDTGDYTVVGNDLTIESSFFEDFSLTTGETLNFVFTFNTGNEATLTVNFVDGFVPVTGIIGVPDTVTAGTPLTLTGTVAPGNATNQTVTWSVYNTGDTGASIAENILSTTAAGVAVVRATITNGATAGTDYSQDFNITVSAAPVTTYNVTFSSDGSAYATKTVNAGESIGSSNFPSDPTRSSYSFGGWFTGENGAGTEFTSATSVNAAMTVYAKWTFIGGGGGGGSKTTPTPTEKTIAVSEISSEVFKDAAGTITAEANMDNAFSNSVEVKVTDTPEDVAGFGLGETDEVYPFDISLYIKGTNEKTKPASGYAVTISLPIPENLLDKKELLSVLHKSDSGVVTEITSRLVQKDGMWYLVFEAMEFSPYALAVRNAGSYDESAGVPYYLDANGNKVFIGFAASGKFIAPSGATVLFKENPKGFTDIGSHWAKSYIGFVTEREMFTSTGENRFEPDTGMTRTMFVTVIGRLYERSYGEIADTTSGGAFTDVDYNGWYGKYVNWAANNGLITGIGNGLFTPDREITRQEMAAILYRFADFLEILPSDMDTVLNYSDAGTISSWAQCAALYCQSADIITGHDDGMFAPEETATRAEVATIIERFVESVLA